jgi:hypothetical protein
MPKAKQPLKAVSVELPSSRSVVIFAVKSREQFFFANAVSEIVRYWHYLLLIMLMMKTPT